METEAKANCRLCFLGENCCRTHGFVADKFIKGVLGVKNEGGYLYITFFYYTVDQLNFHKMFCRGGVFELWGVESN